MAKKTKGPGTKRDGTRFSALPQVVLESPGYRATGYPARSLLIDMTMGYSGKNNGKLTACAKYLKPLGWNSNSVLTRARRELIKCRLILETRKGARPNRAAWYALTWLDLDVTEGLDIDPKLYQRCFRGGYMRPDIDPIQGALLRPRNGAATPSIAPYEAQLIGPSAPPSGAIKTKNTNSLHRVAVPI